MSKPSHIIKTILKSKDSQVSNTAAGRTKVRVKSYPFVGLYKSLMYETIQRSFKRLSSISFSNFVSLLRLGIAAVLVLLILVICGWVIISEHYSSNIKAGVLPILLIGALTCFRILTSGRMFIALNVGDKVSLVIGESGIDSNIRKQNQKHKDNSETK
jgi:hypothetical protein